MHSCNFADEDVGRLVGILVTFETVGLNVPLGLGDVLSSHSHGCPVGVDAGRLGDWEAG